MSLIDGKINLAIDSDAVIYNNGEVVIYKKDISKITTEIKIIYPRARYGPFTPFVSIGFRFFKNDGQVYRYDFGKEKSLEIEAKLKGYRFPLESTLSEILPKYEAIKKQNINDYKMLWQTIVLWLTLFALSGLGVYFYIKKVLLLL